MNLTGGCSRLPLSPVAAAPSGSLLCGAAAPSFSEARAFPDESTPHVRASLKEGESMEKTPPTYLPVRKVEVRPGDHVVMNPALKAWLAAHPQPDNKHG